LAHTLGRIENGEARHVANGPAQAVTEARRNWVKYTDENDVADRRKVVLKVAV